MLKSVLLKDRFFRGRGVSLTELVVVLAVIAILVSLAVSGYQRYLLKARSAEAISDIQQIAICIDRFETATNALPSTLAAAGCARTDPWGNAYAYLDMGHAEGNFRTDRNLNPLSSDYDLYSKGPDGQSAAALTSALSRDDIIRANNGAFVGLAPDY
jgi:general secretion pathway protein G